MLSTPQSLLRLSSLVLVAACSLLSGCGASQSGASPKSAEGGAAQSAGPVQPASSEQDAQLDAELEARIRQVPIKFYMASWCPVCRRAKAWLKKEQYTFELLDVEADEQAATYMMMVNPRGTIPMFEVDGMRVVGFSPEKLREVLKRAAKWRKQERASR